MKENTVIHILITSACDRNCKYCCNKQYDLNDVPYIRDEEMRMTDTVCLTGGEPFEYCNPCNMAGMLKIRYANIKNVYVYSNAMALASYLAGGGKLASIDGITISIKSVEDKYAFENVLVYDSQLNMLRSNILYLFPGYEHVRSMDTFNCEHIIHRKWQKEFKPAKNSVFRKI